MSASFLLLKNGNRLEFASNTGHLLLALSVPDIDVTDTSILQLPINCVLIGDQKEPKDMKFENEQQSVKELVRQAYGGGFSKGKSSFTTRTDSRGYD